MYRLRPVVKNGKKYKNLASFNKECPKRGRGGNICDLDNMRRLKDGGGIAVIKSHDPGGGTVYHRGAKPSGTWRLHFASYEVMKRHLKGRVSTSFGRKVFDLDGHKKRRR